LISYTRRNPVYFGGPGGQSCQLTKKFEINSQISYISYIYIHLEKNVDFKNGFLEFFSGDL
jgi:hypothetical protein